MRRILIALNNTPLKTKIRLYLSPDFAIQGFTSSLKQTPQLCIVDLANWDKVDRFVEINRANKMGRLLLIKAEELAHIPFTVQKVVDDILVLPLHAKELKLRLEKILEMKNPLQHEREKYTKLGDIEQRKRLARNLHNDLSQILFSTRIIAEALPRLWKRHPIEVMTRLEQIRDLTQAAYAEMQTLLFKLNPEQLLETDPEELIQQLANILLGRIAIDVTIEVTEDIDLAPDRHIAVYHIMQEAMDNVRKHANADTLTVQLFKSNGLTLIISDNGQGFNLQQNFSFGLGLSNIHTQAETTGAELKMTSELNKGTTLKVQW